MSPSQKAIGIYGNGVFALLNALIGLTSLASGRFLAVFFGIGACALAIFNIFVIRWAISLTSEEEWLKAEVRKGELRRELRELGEFANFSDLSSAPGAPVARS